MAERPTPPRHRLLAWFKNHFAGDAVVEAKRRGVDPYDILTEMVRADIPTWR
jgi:hypothetical protein